MMVETERKAQERTEWRQFVGRATAASQLPVDDVGLTQKTLQEVLIGHF